jgi:UDP-N-acetylglucosamine 3-dehydrogenase
MRVGVIGVGSMGQNHARVYTDIADLVGIADPDVKQGSSVLGRLQVGISGIHWFPDYRDLLKEDLDAVSVCVPTQLHEDVALDVIRAGVDLIVEKPLAPTVGQAKKIAEAAERAGVTLAVGHVERHNPAVALVKRQLAGGDYGNLITISARRVSSFPVRVRDVGVILDLGVHDVDIIRYLVGSYVDSVYALSGKGPRELHESHANMLLRFKNGVHGFIEVNWLTPSRVRHLALTCRKSFVEVDYTEQSITVSSATLGRMDPFNLYQVPLEHHVRRVHVRKEEPLRLELQDFLRAAEKGVDPLVTGRDAVETLRVVEAAMVSRELGHAINLEPPRRSRTKRAR